MLIKSVPYLINKRITPKLKLVPEAQPRDTNVRVVLFPLTILGRKHILMARSMAEGPYIQTYDFLSSKSAYKWILYNIHKLPCFVIDRLLLKKIDLKIILYT